MRAIPGTLGGGGAAFAPTHWSVVLRSAESTSPEAARRALEELCRAYWPPLYSFVRRRGYNSADAQDLVQGFFAYLLESKAYARADPAKGRFRSFLLGSLKHYLADARDREGRLKRGGDREFVPLDEKLVEDEAAATTAAAGEGIDEDRLFEQRWAFALVTAALKRLQTTYAAEDKTPLFEALRPFIAGGSAPPPDHAELAARLDVSATTLRSHINRLRGRYRGALRDEIARTVSDPAEVDEELRQLRQILTTTPTSTPTSSDPPPAHPPPPAAAEPP